MHLYHIPCKQHTWIEGAADERDAIATSGKAEFITALDLDNSAEDQSAWTYQGPFYVDFDSSDIIETTGQFQRFLSHLEGLGLDLDQGRLYASGKKGFHIEIPMACFTEPRPLQYLPAIYKEMAFSLYHDTLDLAVYTAKKGRMWRCANFRRPDTGTFKVQISVDEALSMTAQTYAELVHQPRPLWNPEPPTFCPNLAKVFVMARDKVSQGLTKRKTNSRTEQEFINRFKGYKLPPTLAAMCRGEIPSREGAGFQNLAMQIAIAAHACGTSENDLIAACQGLIQNHVGDGSRYGTPRKREVELRRMWRYMEGNPTYTAGAAAVRSILPQRAPCRDLRGLA